MWVCNWEIFYCCFKKFDIDQWNSNCQNWGVISQVSVLVKVVALQQLGVVPPPVSLESAQRPLVTHAFIKYTMKYVHFVFLVLFK